MGFLDKLKNMLPVAGQSVKLVEQTYECPFCFKELKANDVHFRANTTAEIVPDELLKAFITASTGASAVMTDLPLAINPAASGFADQYTFKKNNDIYHSITDKATQETFYQKLCPHCHNNLPSIFGQAKLLKICFGGPTNVGKTIYMERLMDTFGDYCATYNYSFLPAGTGEEIVDIIRRAKEARDKMAGTTDQVYLPPLLFDFNCGDKGRYILAFYDIAGEDFVSSKENILETLRGKRLSHSDGVLLLLHPDETSHLNAKGEDTAQDGLDGLAKNEQSITALNNISTQLNRSEDNRVKLAVIINKSDRIRDNLDEEELKPYACLFRDNAQGLDDGELTNVNEASKAYLRKWKPKLVVSIDNLASFSNHYFAVSAIGSDEREEGEGNRLSHQASSTRLTEPLLWLLRENGVVFGQGGEQ